MILASLPSLCGKIGSYLGTSLLLLWALTLGGEDGTGPSGLSSSSPGCELCALPAEAARPLPLLGQVSESQDLVSFVAAAQGGRIQPGLEMLLPAWSLGCPSDLQMLGLGPVSPLGLRTFGPGGLLPGFYLGVFADYEGLNQSISQLCLPLEYVGGQQAHMVTCVYR